MDGMTKGYLIYLMVISPLEFLYSLLRRPSSSFVSIKKYANWIIVGGGRKRKGYANVCICMQMKMHGYAKILVLRFVGMLKKNSRRCNAMRG